MKKRARLSCAFSLLFFAAPAFAQQQQPSPEVAQALADKLFSEVNAGLQCSAGSLTFKKERDVALARVKELEGQLAKAPADKPSD